MSMNKQAIFNVVATHLLTQKKHSRAPNGLGLYRLTYHASDPIRCAIGILIPDEKYNADLMEGEPVSHKWVWESLGRLASSENLEFLRELQMIHDVKEVYDWQNSLQRLAREHDLEMPNPAIGTQQYLDVLQCYST